MKHRLLTLPPARPVLFDSLPVPIRRASVVIALNRKTNAACVPLALKQHSQRFCKRQNVPCGVICNILIKAIADRDNLSSFSHREEVFNRRPNALLTGA